MRGVDAQVGEGAQDVAQALGLGERVAVIAAVDHERQAALHELIKAHEARVVHVDLLRVGVQLDALETQVDDALDFAFGVFVVLVHGGEADELRVLGALVGDEGVDGLDGGRLDGD